MMEAKIQTTNIIAATVTAGLGIAAPWPEVVTGLFFAIAGGFAGMVVSPPEEKLNVFWTLFVAVLIGLLAAMMHPHFADIHGTVAWISGLPLQLLMGGAGLSSRWITRRVSSGNLPFLRKESGK